MQQKQNQKLKFNTILSISDTIVDVGYLYRAPRSGSSQLAVVKVQKKVEVLRRTKGVLYSLNSDIRRTKFRTRKFRQLSQSFSFAPLHGVAIL